MPKIQFTKPTRKTSDDTTANPTRSSSEQIKIAALFPIKDDGTIQTYSTYSYFLLNPSTIEETKSSNWNMKQTPGQSDPILQWSSSGPRKVTFDALVTKDTSQFSEINEVTPTQENNSNNKNLTFLGGIAAKFFNIKAPNISENASSNSSQIKLDISDYLDYYRSLLYPEYDKEYSSTTSPKKLKSSPPLVVLMIGSAITRKSFSDRISSQDDIWVVTNLRIKITKQLPNMSPMEAIVSFELTQYNIKSFDRRRFTWTFT